MVLKVSISMIFSSCLLQLEVTVEDIADKMEVDAFEPGHGVKSDEEIVADVEMSSGKLQTWFI